MEYIIAILIIVVQCSLIDSVDPFLRSIMDKTYYTWTYAGDIDKTQKYTVQDHGKIIHYSNTSDPNSYNYVHIQTISSNQAIYLQESSVLPLYFALVTKNNGNDIYQAFNPNSANTNNINWTNIIHFIKKIE